MTKRKDSKDLKKVGRKSSYKSGYDKKVIDYIKQCVEPEEGKERELPTRAGVAILLDVSLVTIETWGKTYPEFLCALKKVEVSQRNQLINRSFNGTGNANIGKMLLSANHGLREKTEIEHSGGLNVIINN